MWRLLALLALLLFASPSAAQTICCNGTGGGGGGGPGPVQQITINLTSAQLKTIHSQPITVLSAPGANKMNVILQATCYYQFNTTAYTGVSGPSFTYNGVTTALAANDFCNGFQLTRSQIQMMPGRDDNQNIPIYFNQPVIFSDSADYTLGDGTAEIILTYTVLSF